jgi:hypothetical protein
LWTGNYSHGICGEHFCRLESEIKCKMDDGKVNALALNGTVTRPTNIIMNNSTQGHFFKQCLSMSHSFIELTCTSNVKYFFKFFIIITRNGSLIPSVFFGSLGQVMYVVLTLVPIISNTKLCISPSVILFIWPFLTYNQKWGRKVKNLTENTYFLFS